MSGGSSRPQLDIRSFGFRYACYKELGWTPETVAKLTEDEALKLAVVFEESWAYEYKERKKAEHASSGGAGGVETGRASIGFEEVFVFGDDDDSDYWDRPDILYGTPIAD